MIRHAAHLCLMLLVCRGVFAAAQEHSDTVDALAGVALSNDARSTEYLSGLLYDDQRPLGQWRQDFQRYFSTGAFTLPLGLFWESIITDADEGEKSRLGVTSTLCAAEAIRASLPRASELPAAYHSLAMAFRWLQYVSPVLDTNGRTAAFDALSAAFSGNTLAAIANGPQQYSLYVQAALTLCDYADARGRDETGRILGLPTAPMAIWQSFGILVFDNGLLSAQHYSSLASILRAVPQRLHAIRAIVIPDSTGIPPGTTFVTSGQVVYLPFVAMDVYTSPQEFINNGGPVAPQFTAVATQEIVRAVQAVQFAMRPELRVRRDIILANAGIQGARYLRHYRMVAPQVYASNPDELLPALAYIYAIDSRTVFQMAMAFFNLGEHEPVDEYLLLADTLSGGGAAAPLLATSLDGSVSSAAASIGRVHGDWVRPPNPLHANELYANNAIPVDLWFCNSIAYQNTRFIFEFNDQGITKRYLR